MTIVPATLEHLPWLRRLFAALAEEQLAKFPDAAYPAYDAEELDNFTLACARRLGQDPTFMAFVALNAAGDLVGFLGGEIATRAIGKPRHYGAAHWMYIRPEARGAGLAHQLILAGTRWLHANGVGYVELASLAGDAQWAGRGWLPATTHYALPVATIEAAVTPPPASDMPAGAPVVVVAPAGTVPVANGHAPDLET